MADASDPISAGVAPGDAFGGRALELGGLMVDATTLSGVPIRIPLAMRNRPRSAPPRAGHGPPALPGVGMARGVEKLHPEPEEAQLSVLMTLRVSGDPKAVEATDPDVLKTITDRAKEYGVISHHFYGTDDEIFVVDEWPDEGSFQKFFEASPEVGEMMQRAGAGEPAISFWHHLDVHDDIG